MHSPIDGVRAIHNAFRADIAAIDAAATAAARGTPGLEATVERFRFFNEILTYHAHGEEDAVFPIVERSRRSSPRGTRSTTNASMSRLTP